MGHFNTNETMTVADIITKLTEYPLETPVIATWESVRVGLDSTDFELQFDINTQHQIVVIDVDQYG